MQGGKRQFGNNSRGGGGFKGNGGGNRGGGGVRGHTKEMVNS